VRGKGQDKTDKLVSNPSQKEKREKYVRNGKEERLLKIAFRPKAALVPHNNFVFNFNGSI
jgi:hypothetical protein